MCNLYQMAAREHVEVYFRTQDAAAGVAQRAHEQRACRVDRRPAHLPRRLVRRALPEHAQDKRSVVPLQAAQWAAWFAATPHEALAMLRPPPLELFDLSAARHTDRLLGR